MNPKFNVGDIVELKSGGPRMTVQEFVGYSSEYRCQWFGGKKLETGDFPPDSLKPATDENPQKK